MNLLRNFLSRSDEMIDHRRMPLFIRIFFLLSLLFSLFTVSFWFYSSKIYKEISYENEFEKKWIFLNSLKPMILESYLDDDLIKMRSLISYLKKEKIFQYFIFSNHKNIILSSLNFDDIGDKYLKNKYIIYKKYNNFTVYQSEENNDFNYELRLPIYYNNKFLGETYLGISEKNLKELIEEKSLLFSRDYFSLFFIFLFFIFIISVTISILIKAQFSKLSTFIRGISPENLDSEFDITRNDEFGDLAVEVKKLSDSIFAEQQMQDNIAEHLKYNILDKILQNPQKSNHSSYASRRQVTVLYAAIAGFSEYASHTKPEEIVEALNEYIGITTHTIQAHGGYIDKFLGDAIVGIFGVSVYRENHTLRAVRAACAIKNLISEKQEKHRMILDKIRIGMSAGVVLSGNIGSESRIEYSSVGESIKEAFWLNDLAKAKEIIISKSIYEIIKEISTVEALPPQKIPGKGSEIESYKLKSISN